MRAFVDFIVVYYLMLSYYSTGGTCCCHNNDGGERKQPNTIKYKNGDTGKVDFHLTKYKI